MKVLCPQRVELRTGHRTVWLSMCAYLLLNISNLCSRLVTQFLLSFNQLRWLMILELHQLAFESCDLLMLLLDEISHKLVLLVFYSALFMSFLQVFG